MRGRFFSLIFLTLYGNEPTNLSDDIKEEVLKKSINISYQKDIIQWLEQCRKDVATVPIVRESLTQYIHLLKDLTHQNTNQLMSQNIAQTVLNNPDSTKAYFELRAAETQIYETVQQSLEKKLLSLADKLNLKFSADRAPLNSRFYGFRFHTALWDQYNFFIYFQFQSENTRNFGYGVSDSTNMEGSARVKLHDEISKINNSFELTAWWPAFTYWEEYRNWDNKNLAVIHTSSEFITQVDKKLTELKVICDQFCKYHPL